MKKIAKEFSNKRSNFIRTIIEKDIETKKYGGKVITRFPPEPNGYLHIGHAKSICLNFGFAADYKGQCHLRFDDTNPLKESNEFISAIKEDVSWLGFDWGVHLYYASEYFDQLYEWAVYLIKKGKAYVCDLSPEEIREYRGTLTEPGKPSPFRNRSIEENLELFEKMKNGEFPDGSRTLRAKIDMSHPNLNMRDPVMYRILHAPHPRTNNKWCIYPTYDWAHGQSDSIEKITHSICTLEFEDHRALYDWFLEQLNARWHPQQIEFARLNLSYTVMSKRILAQLIKEGYVTNWDDPRLPTLRGLRRRGYTPKAIRNFCEIIGVSKSESIVDIGVLEKCIRDELEETAPRVMCVHQPLRVVIENYPDEKVEELICPYYPTEPSKMGARKVPFSKVLYIEKEDFLENPVEKFFRLSPGREVRLRWSYIIKCVDVIKDSLSGEVKELRCIYNPKSLNSSEALKKKVQGTIHWVSERHAISAEVRIYGRLFTVENPLALASQKGCSWTEFLNKDSLKVVKSAMLEPSMINAKPEERYQFERKGYYFVDPVDSKPPNLVFNRIVPLRSKYFL